MIQGDEYEETTGYGSADIFSRRLCAYDSDDSLRFTDGCRNGFDARLKHASPSAKRG